MSDRVGSDPAIRCQGRARILRTGRGQRDAARSGPCGGAAHPGEARPNGRVKPKHTKQERRRPFGPPPLHAHSPAVKVSQFEPPPDEPLPWPLLWPPL